MPVIVVALLLALYVAPIVICFQKDKPVFAVLGLVGPYTFALIGAVRIARPKSTWAAKHYEPDSQRMRIARHRFPRAA